MQITVDESLTEILQKLAREDGVTPEQLLKKLLDEEDEHRHIVFVPGEGYVRFKCSRTSCEETRIQTKNYYGE